MKVKTFVIFFQGNYTFNKTSIPTKIQGVALPIYGKLRLEIGMLKKANFRRVGCFFIEAEFLPKKKSSKSPYKNGMSLN